jgi:UDP-N-acetylglucosamine diphosphorylase/glucosamine-1-phosphate N-acetyltransferase
MNILLFDEAQCRTQLLPFTFTRPIADIRIGILKISEKWRLRTGSEFSYLTEEYLSEKFPPYLTRETVLVNGAICPSQKLADVVLSLREGERLEQNGKLLAVRPDNKVRFNQLDKVGSSTVEYTGDVCAIERPWQIFLENGPQIRADFDLITSNRSTQSIQDPYTRVYSPERIFVEPGVKIKAAILNAENGPIYLGKNSNVEEGAVVRGPFALGELSTVNANSRMRGDITIGPHCKVGGEISNSVIFGYSNKGHDGFLGNSVIGEWCNIGADTNISNLKNNYAMVKVWDYKKNGFADTGQQFCGLFMGDHSKTGINTMLNTGTVVGVAANIFGAGFPRTFIPSFSWGGAAGFSTFRVDKVKEMANTAMARRGGEYNALEEEILQHVFDLTARFRVWDKPGVV